MFEPYPIAKLHPEVDEVKVKYKEISHLVSEWNKQERVMNKHMVRRVLCSNKVCERGRFFLDMLVRNMIQGKETSKKGTEMCSGKEASDRDCINTVHYEISVTYKQENTN